METRRAAAEIRRLRQRMAQRNSGLVALQQELAKTLLECAQVEVCHRLQTLSSEFSAMRRSYSSLEFFAICHP